MSGKFTAQINAWSEKAKRNMALVVKQSAQDVFEIAQTPVAKGGNMPVDTGFLRNSLISGLNGNGSFEGADSYVLAIAEMEMGDVMIGGWTAAYAVHQEYGTTSMAGRFYMRGAAQQWQGIVARNAAKLK
jgi:hypothetical protein